MNTIPNPDDWMDVITILLVAVIAAIPSWLALRSHKAVRQQGQEVSDIKAQVINGHGDAQPMRADLDRVIASLDSLGQGQHSLRRDVHGLRQELADEQDSRRGHIGELRDALAAVRADIERLHDRWHGEAR